MLFILLAALALAFSVTNFIPPAQAWVIFGTTTYVPDMPPGNEWLNLYDDFYCIYEERDCTIVHAF